MTRRVLGAAAHLGFVLVVAAGGGAVAQADRPYSPGDVFIEQNGSTVQVIGCRGEGPRAECNLRLIKAGPAGAVISPTTFYTLSTLRESERYWVRGGGAPYAGPAIALPATAAPAPAPRPAAPAGTAARTATAPAGQGGVCPRSPYGGPVKGNVPASEALFRRKVTDSYTMGAYGPYWYGVTFEKFSVGAPIRNTVKVVPGVGATRVTNGAPPNAMLYPVDSTQTICEGAPTSAERRRTETKRYCFVSANNEWTCAAR